MSLSIGAANAAENLNFQSIYGPAQTQNTEILMPWAESFAQKTNGELVVHFFPVSALVDVYEAGHALEDGAIDIAGWPAQAAPKETPYGYLFNLPFLTKNAQQGTALAWHMYETMPELKNELEKVGKTLTMWTSAAYSLCSVKPPINKLSDLKEKRILYVDATTSVIIEALGGIPVFITPGDVYVGLQRGMGEVFFGAIPYAKGLKVQEVVKYCTVLPPYQTLMVTSMNNDLFADLKPEWQQLFLDSSGRELSMKVAQNLDEDVANCLKIFQEEGVTIINLEESELDNFKSAVEKTRESFWYDNVREIGLKEDHKTLIDKYYEISESTK